VRLRRRAQFQRVAAVGRRCALPGLVLQVARRDPGASQGGAIGVGFTVSRKVGGAVTRNRARRRLKAIAHQVLPDCARADRDYVLIGRAGTVKRPYAALVNDLTVALQQLRAWRGEAATATGKAPS
jgi:ribonuclease P protein component